MGDLKHNCAGKQWATCVHYEGEIPEWSDIDKCKKPCVTVQEVLEDMYKEITRIRESIDTSELARDFHCIDYDIPEDGKIKVGQALYALESKVCSMSNS